MKGMTPEAMAKACDGKLLGCERILGREVSAVITDSRKTIPDAAFVAIRGERADGHSFVRKVLAEGAMLAIVEEIPADADVPCILVDSTLLAIQRIAGLYRENLGIPVVGVTGSVGKTSTKEAIAAVLSTKYRVLKTAGNFNNNLGLPLTIFRLTEEDEIAVLEMGISHFGEMEELARTARPDVMVITNIGTCHLEFLGDRDGIFRAKTACIPYVREGGEVILNLEDDKLCRVTPKRLREMRLSGIDQDRTGHLQPGREASDPADAAGSERERSDSAEEVSRAGISGPTFYGLSPDAKVFAKDAAMHGLAGTSFTLCMDGRETPVRLALPGRHMILNALAAAAVGRHFGLTDAEIAEGLALLQPLGGRVNILETSYGTVIDDCYNASPASVKAALELLAAASGHKTAILGDMGELGKDERTLHREVGAHGGRLPVDTFLLAGNLSMETAEGIRSVRPDAEILYYPDTEALLEALPEALQPGGSVLVKASHFMGFDRIVRKLEKS